MGGASIYIYNYIYIVIYICGYICIYIYVVVSRFFLWTETNVSTGLTVQTFVFWWRPVACVAQQTCLLCDTADMSTVSHSRHVCCVTQAARRYQTAKFALYFRPVDSFVLLTTRNEKPPYIYSCTLEFNARFARALGQGPGMGRTKMSMTSFPLRMVLGTFQAKFGNAFGSPSAAQGQPRTLIIRQGAALFPTWVSLCPPGTSLEYFPSRFQQQCLFSNGSVPIRGVPGNLIGALGSVLSCTVTCFI